MKTLNNLSLLATAATMGSLMVGCADTDVADFQVEKPQSIADYEYLNEYDALKTYLDREKHPNVKLGAALTASEYNKKEVLYRLANANFDEVVAGNAFKMASCVADGAWNFDAVTSMVNAAEAAGVSVYGHTLLWHEQQRTDWLNNMLKPHIEVKYDTIKGSGDVTILPMIPGRNDEKGNNALYVYNEETTADTYGKQLFYVLPSPMKEGTAYTLTMDVWLEKDLDESLGFWPYAAGGGTQYTGFNVGNIEAGYKFQTIQCDFTASGPHTFLQFPIGHIDGGMWIDNVCLVEQGKTKNLVANGDFSEPVQHLSYSNYGNEGAIAPNTWWSWSWALPAVSNYGIYNINPNLSFRNAETTADTYGLQVFYRLPNALTAGTDYTLTMKVLLENDLDEALGFWPYSPAGGTQYTGFNVGNIEAGKWTEIRCDFTASGDHIFLQWPVGHILGGYRFDDIVLVQAGKTKNLVNNGSFDDPLRTDYLTYWSYGSEGDIDPDTWWSWGWAIPEAKYDDAYETQPATSVAGDKITKTELEIPLTEQEIKDTLIYAMGEWMNAMMDATAGKVKAWDLVNEPISGAGDNGGVYELQHAATTADPSGKFFWQDYLGDIDYVVNASRLARQAYVAQDSMNVASDLKLFINDYNLESDWDGNKKLKSLIEWIGRWERAGAKIDGIGTQMHISFYANETTQANKQAAIENMFRLMAASGKLVRISELDMSYVDASGKELATADLTLAQEKQMAGFYSWIIQKYFELVPAAQQYGICQWCLTDSPAGSGWRPGLPVGLWTEGWQRKPAYAGWADGLKNAK